MKIWIVNLESCVDGEIFFHAVPCKDEKTAKEVLKKKKGEHLQGVYSL